MRHNLVDEVDKIIKGLRDVLAQGGVDIPTSPAIGIVRQIEELQALRVRLVKLGLDVVLTKRVNE